MQPINNDFADYYFLTIDGRIYNSKTKKYLSADHKHTFKLLHKSGQKRISLKALYKLVYGKVFCIDNIEPLENETWKEIENTDGYYYISNYGRVKSLYKYEATILKPTITTSGYERL